MPISPFNPNPTQDLETRENRRTDNALLAELYNVRQVEPGEGNLSGGAVQTDLLAAASVEFPAAGQPRWRLVLHRRPGWRRCGLRVSILYSASVASTNNFAFSLRMAEVSEGLVLSAATDTLSANLLLPGPAVANTLLSYVHVETSVSVIPGAGTDLLFRMFRDKLSASDTNANSLFVQRVLLEVLPR